MSLSRRDFWSSIVLRARPLSTALLAAPQLLHVIYMWVHMMLLYAVRADHLCANDRRRRRCAMSTRVNIAVRGLFATPVAALEVPGREGRNAELSAIILQERETTRSVQASNAGGWHSDREITVWGGPQVAFISRSRQRDGQPLDRRSKW